MRRPRPFLTVVLHAVLLVGAVVALIPFLWLALTAFKPKQDLETLFVSADGLSRLTLDNVRTLIANEPLWAWLVNSLFVAGAQTVLTVVLSCLGGFALAAYRFPGRRPLILLMLAVLMLPGQVLLPSSYELMFHLGWLNSYLAILVPGAVSVFGMLLFRNAFRDVPHELLQAARLDGAGEFRLWWDIAVPCVRPMIGAFTLLVFTGAWNSFIWPQVILSDTAAYTLPIGIAGMMGSAEYETSYGVVMAATILGVLPVMVLFFALQRDFVSGLTAGAVKG